jgi:hypothetical protein
MIARRVFHLSVGEVAAVDLNTGKHIETFK